MAIVSLICAPSFGYLALWLAQRKALWEWGLATPAALLALLFLFGLFECILVALAAGEARQAVPACRVRHGTTPRAGTR